jgi:signal transduction histidine kinase/ActR/RegA family two-component response regulator
MPQPGPKPGHDEALAWREQLAQRSMRVIVVALLGSGAIIAFALRRVETSYLFAALGVVAAAIVGAPLVIGRPRGEARYWLIVVPCLVVALMGYLFVGALSGPGVCLLVTIMLTGLLLGRRALWGVALVSAVLVALIAWGMASGHVAPPDPRDLARTQPRTWLRSLSVTYAAVFVFGGLMLRVVTRMESSLRLARQETLRREQAERERAEAERAALEGKQLEMVGRLAAGVAHDFNNNLTAIIGCAELLKLELPEQHDGRELSDSILRASQRLAELTRQLLAYSRKARMLQAPTDLHAIINEAVSLLRRSSDPNVRVVTELHAQQPIIAADAALLQSAIMNLLINARDAMPEGGKLTVGTSTIDLTRTSAKGLPTGPCLLIEVVDTGRGIPREQLPHVFDPFFTTKPVGKGTGLGLAAVSGTIKAHGGSIEVNSDVGVGSAFRIYLPSSDNAGAVAGPLATTVVHGEGEILLVEDDAMVSMTAVATLQSFGYRVTSVSSGKAALEQVSAHPGRFDLVLLDLRMPGLSGEATFDQLRELEPGLPVLIWSGYAAEQDVSAMLRRGAAGFVQKPYRVADLSRTVAESMRSLRVRSTA